MSRYEIREIAQTFYIAHIEENGDISLLRESGAFNSNNNSKARTFKIRSRAERYIEKVEGRLRERMVKTM